MPKIEVFIYLPLALIGTMGSIVASFVLSQAMPLGLSEMGSFGRRKTVSWFIGIYLISWFHPFFYVSYRCFTIECPGNLGYVLNLFYHLLVLIVVGAGFPLLLRRILAVQEMSDDFS